VQRRDCGDEEDRHRDWHSLTFMSIEIIRAARSPPYSTGHRRAPDLPRPIMAPHARLKPLTKLGSLGC
jgi:hypothetical protein